MDVATFVEILIVVGFAAVGVAAGLLYLAGKFRGRRGR